MKGIQSILIGIALSSCLGCLSRTSYSIHLPQPTGNPFSTLKPSPTPPPTPSSTPGPTGPTFKTTVEWQVSNSGYLTFEPFSPLWTFENSIFFVWVDSKFVPKVTQITNGIEKTVPLDTENDYTVTTDEHHRFSMGIDKKGYIHITGNMHNYQGQTSQGGGKDYPKAYRGQRILYWVSNRPGNISSGFSFAGGKDASTALPGTGWTYGQFFTDNYGELYYSSRVKAITGGHFPGEMGLGLYRYNTSTATWTALGGLADRIREGTYNKVLLWEKAGMAESGGWYQGLRGAFKFDSKNRLHFASPINTDSSLEGSNRVVYAVSDDGGNTWRKANGTPIPGLPIRGADGTTNQGDIVATAAKGKRFWENVGVVADRNGKVGVGWDDGEGNIMRTWDGTSWSTQNSQYNSKNKTNSIYGYLTPEDNLVFTNDRTPRLQFTTSFDGKSYEHVFKGYDRFYCLDEYGLRTTGVIYGIGINYKNRVQAILKTTITLDSQP